MTQTGLATIDVRAVTGQFFRWLSDHALPLWSTEGVDREGGGFIEQLTVDGQPIADVRRARLVARQIFAFRSAGALGWSGPAAGLVEHGLAALRAHHLTDDVRVVPRFVAATGGREGGFDLYDQAFVLFGLAHAYAQTGEETLRTTALSILARMREGWSHPLGGFAEHRPPQPPLKANPHMHLLEAALAWADLSEDEAWSGLAGEIVELCLRRFIDPAKGSLHEYFATDWSVLRGPDDVVEPGHQAEWAWLLLRAQKVTPIGGVAAVGARLFEIAEGQGLDRNQQRLMNELNPDLSPRDRRLRLWPQTERIKALVAFIERETDERGRRELEDRLGRSIEALLGYFDHPIAGSWWEHFDERGEPLQEPARASSLYHIMGAANELARFTGLKLG